MPCLPAVTKPVWFCLQFADDSPAMIRLPWNTLHPLLPAVPTRMPLLPAVTTCIHRRHRLRCTGQSTQDAIIVDRTYGQPKKYRRSGAKDMKALLVGRKTSRCVIMSSRGCVLVARTSWLQRRAAGPHNILMFAQTILCCRCCL